MLCRVMTVNAMQFGFMPERGTSMPCLSRDGCKKSIMLKERVVYVFCGLRESLLQSSEECVGMGNEEERNTRSFS